MSVCFIYLNISMTKWIHMSFSCEPQLNPLPHFRLIFLSVYLIKQLQNFLTVHFGICNAKKRDLHFYEMKLYSCDVNKIMKS